MRFRKLKLLGKGSCGSLHLAGSVDDDNNSSVTSNFSALKSGTLPSTISYLMREKQFLDELVGYPFIIQCLGDDQSIENGQRTYNLMLEYAPGGTLKGLMQQESGGRIPESEVACYTAMLLHGLSTAHSKGTVHCNMKPDNILVFPMEPGDGVPYHILKIADFGSAMKVWEKEIEGDEYRCLNRGALLYASHEAVFSGDHSRATDIWSLGCIVVEMLTGHPMWGSGCTRNELIDLMATERYNIPLWLSKIAIDFLKRCFEINPDKRWTARTLLNHPFIANNLRHFRGIEDMIHNYQYGLTTDASPSGVCRTNTFSDATGIYEPSKEPFNGHVQQSNDVKETTSAGSGCNKRA